jgi:hypothetical protein
MELILTLILSIVYMLFKELEEESHQNRFKGKYSMWLNNEESYINKWKLNKYQKPLPYIKKWYHFGFGARYEEKFPYSSTILVSVTDGEHFFQLIQILCIYGIVTIYSICGGISFLLGVLILGMLKETILKNIIT